MLLSLNGIQAQQQVAVAEVAEETPLPPPLALPLADLSNVPESGGTFWSAQRLDAFPPMPLSVP